jgi:hypothetical protein
MQKCDTAAIARLDTLTDPESSARSATKISKVRMSGGMTSTLC